MKRIFSLFCVITMAAFAWAQVSYDVIPRPRSVELSAKGEVYNLVQGAVVTYDQKNEALRNCAELLSEYLREDSDFELRVEADVRKGASVVLCLGLKNDNPDAYELTVGKQGVVIRGASESGVFRGVQTLRKAIGIESGERIALPYVTVKDEPRFAYRGVHFDTARHFFPLDFIKTYIDLMALHGCNEFHWHLTEDQGWRFEVKSMPELAEKGSVRKQTTLGRNAGIYDGQPYGGYYTQQDCREIVEYAAKRFINVIPEIDLPGHMLCMSIPNWAARAVPTRCGPSGASPRTCFVPVTPRRWSS